jgi:hypothetical protein
MDTFLTPTWWLHKYLVLRKLCSWGQPRPIRWRLQTSVMALPFFLRYTIYARCRCPTLQDLVLSFHGAIAASGPGPPHYRGFTIALRHTTLGRTPLDEWLARRRDLYLATHNTHKRRDIHAPDEIRTRNPNKRQAADPPLRPRGHWDWR